MWPYDDPKIRLYNLRREIARRIWDARNFRINCVLEVDQDLRDLVGLCPPSIFDKAYKLYHKYKNKIFAILKFKHIGLKIKNKAIKSREVAFLGGEFYK